ncbi:MAG: hypothetical protein IJ087_08235 [Eggerthellaceae bacterium]|nr:hypothetical protein [Eggerthellaceae bacterium]
MNTPVPDKTTHAQDPVDDPDIESAGDDSAADEETGASPGTAQACNDLGLNSLTANLEKFGIKPPGQS